MGRLQPESSGNLYIQCVAEVIGKVRGNGIPIGRFSVRIKLSDKVLDARVKIE